MRMNNLFDTIVDLILACMGIVIGVSIYGGIAFVIYVLIFDSSPNVAL